MFGSMKMNKNQHKNERTVLRELADRQNSAKEGYALGRGAAKSLGMSFDEYEQTCKNLENQNKVVILPKNFHLDGDAEIVILPLPLSYEITTWQLKPGVEPIEENEEFKSVSDSISINGKEIAVRREKIDCLKQEIVYDPKRVPKSFKSDMNAYYVKPGVPLSSPQLVREENFKFKHRNDIKEKMSTADHPISNPKF